MCFSRARVAASLVFCLMFCVLQQGSCCSIFSFLCGVLCASVGLVLLDLQFSVQCFVCFSRARVARSLASCVVFCVLQQGSCCSIFSFLCSVLCASVGLVLLDLQLPVQCFVGRCLFFCSFSFGHCIVCPSSIYGFGLQTLVSSNFSCRYRHNITDKNYHLALNSNDLLTQYNVLHLEHCYSVRRFNIKNYNRHCRNTFKI